MATYLLDPDVCFLNHGSFGATPKEILDAQHAMRIEMEREPVDFLARTIESRWHSAIGAVAGFLSSDPDGTVFVQNATAGVNAVIASFPWSKGDQILTTNHRYDAVRHTLDHAAHRAGVTVKEAAVPFPIQDPEQVIQAVEDSLTPQTRMLVIDQITSPTALRFPVKKIVDIARSRGIATLIDGAHAPGQIDIDINRLSPDFWVGNFHKWMCAPKGCAVLTVANQWKPLIHPGVISHGYMKGLQAEFSWTGTLDPTAWFCAPLAIELHKKQGGANFRSAHHELVRQGRKVIADALGVDLPHPDRSDLYGSMATIPLPCSIDDIPLLFEKLRTEDNIEVPIIPWGGRAWVRISGFAGTNKPEQYQYLANRLKRRLTP